jgi:hypothetical protein
MGYTQVALEDKLLEIYPELEEHGVKLALSFDGEKDAWMVSLDKDGKSLDTFLNKKDADECIDGTKCVYLGVKIGEFLKNFEEDIGE